MKTLLINIKELLQVRENPIKMVSGKEMGVLPKINDAFLLLENNIISEFGKMEDCPKLNNVNK